MATIRKWYRVIREGVAEVARLTPERAEKLRDLGYRVEETFVEETERTRGRFFGSSRDWRKGREA